MSSFRHPTSAGTLDQSSTYPPINQKNRSQLEESSVRLDKTNRIMSADNSHQQRRATRAATALAKQPVPPQTRIESFLTFVEKYKNMFDGIQTSKKVQTGLLITQLVVSLGEVALYPYYERWYIAFICMMQAICTTAMLVYEKVMYPKKPNPKTLAKVYLLYTLISGFMTFTSSSVVFVLQTEATFLQIKCCEKSTYSALDSCIDNWLEQGLVIPKHFITSCPDAILWRSAFNKLNNVSFILIPFTVFQAISHHFTTSLIINFMRQGYIFSMTETPTKEPAPSTAIA
ncbi:hypothetical protein HDU97_001493 [Phlyctochytrium planicorne]|nr:hypothetical protein HDU97_001493 [Phlyctochytrium planicorne]